MGLLWSRPLAVILHWAPATGPRLEGDAAVWRGNDSAFRSTVHSKVVQVAELSLLQSVVRREFMGFFFPASFTSQKQGNIYNSMGLELKVSENLVSKRLMTKCVSFTAFEMALNWTVLSSLSFSLSPSHPFHTHPSCHHSLWWGHETGGSRMPNNTGETETKQFVCTCQFTWRTEVENSFALFMSLKKAEYN